jgi:hypothetical protein
MTPLLVGMALLWLFSKKSTAAAASAAPGPAATPAPGPATSPGTGSIWAGWIGEERILDYRLYRGVCMHIDAIVHNYLVENRQMGWTDDEYNGMPTERTSALSYKFKRELPTCVPRDVIYTAGTP